MLHALVSEPSLLSQRASVAGMLRGSMQAGPLRRPWRMPHDHTLDEEFGVRHDDEAAIGCADERGANLNVFDFAALTGKLDFVADAEGLGKEQQDAGEEVLEYVAESEPDRDAANAEDLDEIARVK